MSASPTLFNRATKSNQRVIQTPASFTRVTEPDESVVQPSTGEEISGAKLDTLPRERPVVSSQRWSLYFCSWILISLLAGVIAGRFLYLLWEHVASHDQQLTWHQAAIQRLTKTQAVISDQASHLKTLDTSVSSIQALFNAQSKKLSDLEKGEAEIRNQLNGMNSHWQKQMNALLKEEASVVAASNPKIGNPTAAKSLPAPQAQSTSDKHNETFSPDLKPTPNSYAQMLPSGLVVWMTPRPGFPKRIPTSVIGHVRGLGMLVHDWEDNKHYFITDSGSWLPDQR